MSLGRDNIIHLKLTADGQITCGGAEADVMGPHATLKYDAVLDKVHASGYAGAALAACDVILYAGTTKSGTAVTSAMDLHGNGAAVNAAGVLVDANKVWSSGQEFCMSENGTNTKTIDRLEIDLYFRTVST